MRTLLLLLTVFFVMNLSSCVVHTRPANAVAIKAAPKNHKVVVVKGKRYYFWNGKHYKKTRRGYVVVRV